VKALEISRESWHYFVAAKWGKYEDGDFCHYVRRFLLGSLLMLLAAAGIVFVGYAVVSGLYVVYQFVMTGHWIKPDGWWGVGAVLDCVVLLTALIMAVLYQVSKYIKYRKDEARNQRRAALDAYFDEHGCYPAAPEPGFVSKAYRSIKDKTCYRIALR
jgi:uncharacterized membrane protein